MSQDPVIGVIGGMGPHAGLDLIEKIIDQTDASIDQEHISVAMLSYPGRIPDRSSFLSGKTDHNPAYAMAEQAHLLARAGATVAAIPCNTAHGPAIFDVLQQEIDQAGHGLRLLHLIEEAVRFIDRHHSQFSRIGVLGTTAVFRLRLYSKMLETHGFEPIVPDENVQENIVNRTIFDPSYGLKAQSTPVSKIARQSLVSAIEHLREKGAQAVILGCTELPLAIPEPEVNGLPMIDPTLALARALIAATAPEKLRAL